MTQPRGHAPEHGTHYHVDPKSTPKRTTTRTKSNAASARGTGMPTKGGKAMKPKHR